MMASLRSGDSVEMLQPVPAPIAFDPPTELIGAAFFVHMAGQGRVDRALRQRLLDAAEALPAEGLPSAWYHLADIAKRYVRDWSSYPMAPSFDFRELIDRAVEAGTPGAAAWQDRYR